MKIASYIVQGSDIGVWQLGAKGGFWLKVTVKRKLD